MPRAARGVTQRRTRFQPARRQNPLDRQPIGCDSLAWWQVRRRPARRRARCQRRVNASMTRSTATLESAAANETGARRLIAPTRRNSPARNGNTLFAAKPIEMAFHSDRAAIGAPSSPGSRQQLPARYAQGKNGIGGEHDGNRHRGTTSRGPDDRPRRPQKGSFRKAHHTSAAEMTTPRPICSARAPRRSGCVTRQRNQVQEFEDVRAQPIDRRRGIGEQRPDLVAKLFGARECGRPAVQQRGHRYDLGTDQSAQRRRLIVRRKLLRAARGERILEA